MRYGDTLYQSIGLTNLDNLAAPATELGDKWLVPAASWTHGVLCGLSLSCDFISKL